MMNQHKKVTIMAIMLLCMPALSHSLSADELWTPFPTYRSANYAYRFIAIGSAVVGFGKTLEAAVKSNDYPPSESTHPLAHMATMTLAGPVAGLIFGKMVATAIDLYSWNAKLFGKTLKI